MSHSRKGQAMIEYLMYFSISFVVFLGLLIFIFYFENAEVTEIKFNALSEHGYQTQSMFFVLAQMNPTFTQTITLKETINGETYDFAIISSNLYLTQEDLEIILPLPIINGNTTNKTFTVTVVQDEVRLT